MQRVKLRGISRDTKKEGKMKEKKVNLKIRYSPKSKAHTVYKLADGARVPGVTTITAQLGWSKQALIRWANNLGLQGIDSNKYVDDKAAIGTLAHAMILNELQGKPTDTSDYSKNQIDAAENSCLSFYEWQKGHTLEPILIETPLVSEQFKYGGTPDFYGKVDGIFEVLDLKTGKGIYAEHLVQVAAYKYLLEESNGPVDRVRILNIPRAEDEFFQERQMVDLSLYWRVFVYCLELYNLEKQIRRGE